MSDYSERLAEVNARIATTSIKGKDYAEVNQRILAFWELFPNGRIVTEKVQDNGQRCDFICKVYRCSTDDEPVSTGHAFEEKKGMINTTSYVENCETSAIGRALGILGIGAVKAVASAEEVRHAMAQQGIEDDYMQPVRDWWKAFVPLFLDSNEAMGNLLKNIGAKDMKSLTREQAEKAVAHMAQVYAERTQGA
ncbi:MAG: hypothetical protein IKF78_16195 [Atopobiaceae bacterium]|nr:hypothetical protein [Atopobiaceae bacterium]